MIIVMKIMLNHPTFTELLTERRTFLKYPLVFIIIIIIIFFEDFMVTLILRHGNNDDYDESRFLKYLIKHFINF